MLQDKTSGLPCSVTPHLTAAQVISKVDGNHRAATPAVCRGVEAGLRARSAPHTGPEDGSAQPDWITAADA